MSDNLTLGNVFVVHVVFSPETQITWILHQAHYHMEKDCRHTLWKTYTKCRCLWSHRIHSDPINLMCPLFQNIHPALGCVKGKVCFKNKAIMTQEKGLKGKQIGHQGRGGGRDTEHLREALIKSFKWRPLMKYRWETLSCSRWRALDKTHIDVCNVTKKHSR